MSITIPMWLLYSLCGILAIILLFCAYIGIIVLSDFYNPFKRFKK